LKYGGLKNKSVLFFLNQSNFQPAPVTAFFCLQQRRTVMDKEPQRLSAGIAGTMLPLSCRVIWGHNTNLFIFGGPSSLKIDRE
jgi:hypothetical protein